MPLPHDFPEIDPDRCTGCGRCVAACHERCITLEVSGFRKYALLVRPQLCNGCGACLAACPVRALT
ncbi:4Fe-4S dicluster domain-containing protein [Geomonas terrae]|uniref:4Fe-4S dicluster domain-containing protein n=1 Tax=Geomonas terrae TaxID=2562681 RepID=A0A4S1CLH0_9BACT|nr:4Fe-4S binding protein [Geomonas terrae]TGU74110.1 4Fe-4S dicluster domain-containing protein [Geomonas terrae]